MTWLGGEAFLIDFWKKYLEVSEYVYYILEFLTIFAGIHFSGIS
jgi:hypothetical protein